MNKFSDNLYIGEFDFFFEFLADVVVFFFSDFECVFDLFKLLVERDFFLFVDYFSLDFFFLIEFCLFF